MKNEKFGKPWLKIWGVVKMKTKHTPTSKKVFLKMLRLKN